MKKFFLGLLCTTSVMSIAQNYTSYFTGSTVDKDTVGQSGICLMGGASEDDNAMIWFLERANQGDVLVLRTSGSDGYNDYMFNQLGVTLNSVETIVCNNANASNDAYVQDKVKNAEAIWFAGGDQWNYVSYWRDSPIDSLINLGITTKGLVLGGTSAGMAIQGGYYFSAENGTVTSANALSNPYNIDMTVDNTPFIEHDILANTITDTHYDDPDRKGRHTAFLARMISDDGVLFAQGIACDEYTAVCVDETGIAKVYGGYPTYDDNAYFLRVNCGNMDTDPTPETCQAGSPLDWNRGEHALQVYRIQGTASANNHFNLNDWTDASGGEWQRWWVDNGTLNEGASSEIDCSATIHESVDEWMVYPNPTTHLLHIKSNQKLSTEIYQTNGSLVLKSDQLSIDVSHLESGVYVMKLIDSNHTKIIKLSIK